MLVMLKRTWGGPFRRSVFDTGGKLVKVLVFQPGVPVEINDIELAAVLNDIGPALVEAEIKPVESIEPERREEPPVKASKRGKNS